MQWEVEQKFAVADREKTLAKLAGFAVVFGEPIVQVDAYFNHPARDFAATDEALRLRRSGDLNCLTYKGPRIDAQTKTRRELELELPAGEAVIDQFAELLGALGFRPAGVVRKRRRVSTIPWQDFSAEVAWDEVESLGTFIELEISTSDASPDQALAALASLADRLQLKSQERRSYLELVLALPS